MIKKNKTKQNTRPTLPGLVTRELPLDSRLIYHVWR